MDIRVAAYNPVTVTTFASRAGNPLATAYVQNAANSGPVPAVNATTPVQNAVTNSIATTGEGYTDHIRGSLINILA
jgi:hypothetical protein